MRSKFGQSMAKSYFMATRASKSSISLLTLTLLYFQTTET